MYVLIIVGEKLFIFKYGGLPENFEKDLSVLEKMLGHLIEPALKH
jgi:hypothetical protein